MWARDMPSVRFVLRFLVAMITGTLLAPLPAKAMQFELAQSPVAQFPEGNIIIVGRGPILTGDFTRFSAALNRARQTGRSIVLLALNSRGGNVAEAILMASAIRSGRLAVAVPRGSQCASACFLMFTASAERLAGAGAMIGVHSASQNGAETDASLAVTTLMARDASALGVPPMVVGGQPPAGNAATAGHTQDEPLEQEYRGAYFCADRIGQLRLAMFVAGVDGRRRAMVAFGPNATSPNQPRGAFETWGTIEPGSGRLSLVPVKWLSQPSGYGWFGLDGRSDDAGKSFEGRVTSSPGCTQFTMVRSEPLTSRR